MVNEAKVVKGILAALEVFVKKYSEQESKSETGKAAIQVLQYAVPSAAAFLQAYHSNDYEPELLENETPIEQPQPEKEPENDATEKSNEDIKADIEE